METKKKFEKILGTIIFFLILLVLIIFIYFFKNSNEEEFKNNSISDNMKSKSNLIKNENKFEAYNKEEYEELDFNSEIVQNLFPLTGAFPSNDLQYITKIRNINRNDITNDFILKFAWSKVTKEDWAESYVAEGEILNIDADLLDKYIKQIFGNISYQKADFSNKDLVLGSSTANLYDIKYNEQENKYYINMGAGDGVADSFIKYLYPKAIKYDDRIEIIIHPIYIRNCGEIQKDDGSYSFSYIVYKHYNYETNTFNSRLTDTMYTVFEESKPGQIEPEYNKMIQALQVNELERYIITYKFNNETKQYEFDSLGAK